MMLLPLPATSSTSASASSSSSWLSLAIRLTVYLGSCTLLHVTASPLYSSLLVSSVCPSISLSVCVRRCLPYAAPCLRMHVAFSGGRAWTDRCIDMPKRWLFLFLAGSQFARTVGKFVELTKLNCSSAKTVYVYNIIIYILVHIK